MTRRHVLQLTSLGIMAAVAALAFQKPEAKKLLILEWAHKAPKETPPVAVLIEMGLKDADAKSWSGNATVTGATVVHREGYRFRDRRQAARSERLAGVVAQADALAAEHAAGRHAGTVRHRRRRPAPGRRQARRRFIDSRERAARCDEKVPLKDVLAGKPHAIQNGRAVVRLVTTATPVVIEQDRGRLPRRLLRPRRHALGGVHQLHGEGGRAGASRRRTSRSSRRISRRSTRRNSAISCSSSRTATASGASRSRSRGRRKT